MDQGDIYVFDLNTSTFASYSIEFGKLFPGSKAAPVVDIKCHTTKMHRLLISYKDIAVCVFSLNKNTIIQNITMTEQYLLEKGSALAVEWIGPECTEFIVGF